MLSFIGRILCSCTLFVVLLFGMILICLIFFKSRNRKTLKLFTFVVTEYLELWEVDIESFIFSLNQIKGK